MDDTFEIKLTTPEMVLIGSIMDLPNLPIDEPPPLDESAPEALWVIAQNALSERGYIRLPFGENEELALDQTVATMVSVLGYPQYGLEAQTFREKRVEPERVQWLGLGELLVEQAQDGSDTHILTACRTGEVALGRLLDFLGLKKQPPAHTESFRIAVEDMAQVPYIIAGDGQEDGAAFLRGAGAPAKAAARLAAALENPVRQSVLRVSAWPDGEPQEIGRLTLLEEVYGLWLITPDETDGDTLVVAPVTGVEAADRVRQLAFRVLPGEPA